MIPVGEATQSVIRYGNRPYVHVFGHRSQVHKVGDLCVLSDDATQPRCGSPKVSDTNLGTPRRLPRYA